jgi:hypothetical protein
MRLFCWNSCKSAGFAVSCLRFGEVLEKIPADLHLFPCIIEDLREIAVLLQEFALRV